MASQEPVVFGVRKGDRVSLQTDATWRDTADTDKNGSNKGQSERKETYMSDNPEFTINDERVKRAIDRSFIRSVNLEDIIGELKRRGFQMLEGNGYNLKGRVMFIPSALLPEKHEGAKVTEGTETIAGAIASNVGLPAERQNSAGIGEDTYLPESSGSAGNREEDAYARGMQGDTGEPDTLPVSEESPTTGADGVRTKVSQEE